MNTKTGLCLALAVTVLALGAATASAIERLAFRPGGEITMAGPVTFVAGETTIRCNVTMVGTLTRTLVPATAETRLGSIGSASASECTGGRIRLLVPISIDFARWLIYLETERIIGLLVRFRNFGVLIEETLGLKRCLFGPTVELLIGIERVREPEGEYLTTEVSYLTGSIIELFRSLGLLGCPAEGSMAGTMSLRPTQTVAVV